MEIPLTLRILFSFQPINDREKEVFKFDEKIVAEMMHKLDKNIFYLGGQISMKYDYKISLNDIEMVYIIWSNLYSRNFLIQFTSRMVFFSPSKLPTTQDTP
jgi:hypothetical protein